MSILSSPKTRLVAFLFLALLACLPVRAQRQSENLGRGVVALRATTTEAHITWRLLGNDPADVAFNLYRSIGGGAALRVNTTPITATTDYRDMLAEGDFASAIAYFVCPVVDGVELPASASYTLPAGTVAGRQFITFALSSPRPNPASTANYDVKFCWVGDLDGDGEYDFVVDRLSTSTTAAEVQYLEAYKRDGTFLWRMNLGINSLIQSNTYEPGASTVSIGDGDNVTVFDMDGDGRAEVIVRTAHGVTVANAAGTEVASITAANNTDQFVSVFDGVSGAERARLALPNPWAEHGTLNSKCAIAFLDGVRPSVIFYGYNRADAGPFYRSFSAFDFRDGTLSLRWNWAQDQAVQPGAEGHQIRIADVDNDGRDEICDIGHVIDDDGTQLFYTDLTHGDRLHVADIDPDHPGLESYAIQQYNPRLLASALYGSGTGEMLVRRYMTNLGDVGRGIAIDLDPSHFGLEMYCTQPGIFDAKGNRIFTNTVWPPEGLWWDGDLSREFIDGSGSGAYNPVINKFNPGSGVTDRLHTLFNDDTGSYVIRQAYGGRPAFMGDILGDWREELVFVTSDYASLRIYTTSTPATNRLYALMQNPAYRGQTTTKGYYEASYTDYYLGTDMPPPPPPPVTSARLVWQGGAGAANTWDESTAAWREGVLGVTTTTYVGGDAVLFDLTGNAAAPVVLSGKLAPGAVTVYSPTSYTFDGTAGSLGGTMSLTKVGAGSLTLTGSHSFTGTTTVWDGALAVDGELSASPVVVWGGTWGGPLAQGATGGRLAGSGRVAQPVTLNYRAGLTPGAGMGAAGTLYLDGGLTTAAGSTLAFDLSDDPTGLSKANDQLVVAGDLTLGGATTLHFHLLDGTLAPGTYTVATVSGTLSGAANLTITGLDGIPYSLSTSGGAIAIVVPTTRAAASVAWQGGPGAQWDNSVTPAWLRGGSADVFVAGDAVTFNATGAATPSVALTQAVSPASTTVASDTDYTIAGSGRIVGSGGLTKTGTGRLTLATANTFTGPVAITGGTVSIATMSNSGAAGPLGSAPAASGGLTLDGGTLQFTGADATSTDRLVTLGANGGTFDVTTAGIGFQLTGSVEGPGQLVKNGAGTLTLSTPNTYAGGTVINAGMIIMPSAAANAAGLGSGPVTLNGGTLAMSNNTTTYGTVAAWNMVVPAGATARLELDGRSSLTGSLTGAGTLELYTPFSRTELNGDWSAFAGVINAVTDADGGDLRFWNTAGLPAAELNLGVRTYAYFNAALSANLSFPLGALSGVSGSTLNGCTTAGRTITWTIGERGTDSTFAGTIVNGTGITALTKVGGGTLTLAGANTYSGATTVSAGTLLINGTSSSSAFTVQAGGVLGGSGTITGAVAFQSGSGLARSAAPLNVAGTVSLAGTVAAVSTSALECGTYPLLVATTITGSPTFTYSGPLAANQTATVVQVGNGLFLTIGSTDPVRASAAVTWTGAVSGFWDAVSANWKFNSDGAATYFAAGDAVVFDDSLAGNASLTLVSAVAPASVTFANTTTSYALVSGGGGISGAATLTKNGSGTVTLAGGNTYTGATTVNAGTLLVNGTSDGSSFTVQSGAVLGGTGTITGDVTLGAGSGLRAAAAGSLNVNGTVTLGGAIAITAPAIIPDGTYTIVAATALSGSATWTYTAPLDNQQTAAITTSGGAIVLTLSGTQPIRPLQPVQWTGAVSAVWNSAVANWRLQADGTATTFVKGDTAVFDDTSAGNRSITIPSAVEPVAVSVNNTTVAYTLTGTSPGISGAAALTKAGTGTLTMAGTNTYTGGTIISGGTLTLSATTAIGSGPVTLAGGTWATGALTPTNAIVVSTDSTITGGHAGGNHGIKAVSGSGTLTLTATTGVFDLEGDMTAFTGRIALGGTGNYRLYGTTGSSAADFDLGTRALSARSGTAIALGSLTGTSTATLSVDKNWTTYSIGGNHKSTTFPGTITNPSGYTTSINKVGTGTLTLTGTNTYLGATTVSSGTLVIAGAQSNGAGATTVNGGTLRITGSLTNTSTVEVKSGATLELTGTLTTSTLTIRAGGKLIGGGAIIGNVVNEGLISASGSASFAVTGNVTNAATGVIRLSRGAGFNCTGPFANLGVLDVITAGAFPAAGETGTVLTAASLRIVDFAYAADAGTVLTLAAAYEGHTYQLERTTDLADSGSWELLGAAVEGDGTSLVLVDDTPPEPAERCFYRVRVDPPEIPVQ